MTMIAMLTLLLAQAPPADAAAAETKTVSVTVTDDKGNPVEGLSREDVALLENGVARDVVSLTLDRRPLTLAFLLDTSEAVASSLRLHLIDAVVGFLRQLPDGSRYALWTTGDRPMKLVDFTTEADAVRNALRRVAPQGGTTMLDAIVEASEDLKKKEGERFAVGAVTGVGPEFSSRSKEQVVDRLKDDSATFLGLIIEEGATSLENRNTYDYVFDHLARKSGGLFEVTLSAMGAENSLKKMAAHLRSQYQLTYATVPDLKPRKIEVQIARPRTRVRVGPPRNP
jgi:VWFA-related protein